MTAAVAAGQDPAGLQQRIIEVFEGHRDAVVRVKAGFRDVNEEGKTHVTLKVGTGFLVSGEGHVLVNSSRALGADRIWVEAGGRTYPAEPLGHDPLTNVSLLRVAGLPEDPAYLPIDSGVGMPPVGAMVIAISCPLDFEPSPGFGVVTGIENKLGTQVFPTRYIRTNIAVDLGQGGCPILDLNGRLVGMTVASIPEIGSSYAMPAEALIRVRDDLLFAGERVHSWMGFEVADSRGPEGRNRVRLSAIVEDSPAAEAGLEVDDRLLAIDGRPVETTADMPHAVFFTRAGAYASVRIERDGEPRDISVKTLPRPPEHPLVVQHAGASGEPADRPVAADSLRPGEGAEEQVEVPAVQ